MHLVEVVGKKNKNLKKNEKKTLKKKINKMRKIQIKLFTTLHHRLVFTFYKNSGFNASPSPLKNKKKLIKKTTKSTHQKYAKNAKNKKTFDKMLHNI